MELDEIQEFIDNFDAAQFSSGDDFQVRRSPTKDDLRRAWKLKEKLGRKHRMNQVFDDDQWLEDECSVCITQEEIDLLLEGARD